VQHPLVRWLIAAICMAVLATILSPTQAAVAEPVAPPADLAAPAPTTHHPRVSVTQYKAMKKVVRVKRKAHGRTLDYREAKKEFGKKVSWRRQFAAGWKLSGGKLTHVSKAETKAIEKVRRAKQPPTPGAAALHLLQAAPNCQGRVGHELHPNTDYYHWDYFNSCQTNKLIRNFSWCVGGAGLIAGMLGNPGVGAIMALFIGICGGAVGWISTAQANSDVSAIIVKNGDIVKFEPRNPTPKNPVRYQVPVRISPQ